MTGMVKWFNAEKGFGFIVADKGEKEVFVHQDALLGASFLRCGQRVRFEILNLPAGPRAKSVQLIEEKAMAAYAAD